MGGRQAIGGILVLVALVAAAWWWADTASEAPATDDLLGADVGTTDRAPTLVADSRAPTEQPSEAGETADAGELLRALRATDAKGRLEILWNLHKRLPADAELIRYLMDLVRSSDPRKPIFGWVWLRFGTLPVEAAPEIVTFVADDSPAVRQVVLRTLDTWLRQGKQVDLPSLVAVYDDADWGVRHWAREVVALGVPYDEALAARLETVVAEANFLAAAALARMGDPAFDRFLVLLESVETKARAVLFNALTCAPRERVRRALPAIERGLRDPAPEVQMAATMALHPLGADCTSCLEALRLLLDDQKPDLCAAAMGVLATIGPPAAETTPALLDLLEDRDEQLSNAAAKALGAIRARSGIAVPALRKRVVEQHTDEAARALGAYGSAGERAALDVLANGDPYAQYTALLAIAARGAAASAAAISAVVRFVRQKDDHDLRVRAIGTLAYIGEAAAPEGVPAIMAALGDREFPLDPRTAAGTLRLLGERARAALRRALASGDAFLQCQAAKTLQFFPAESQFALDELVALFQAKDLELRRTAVLALRVCVMHPEWEGVAYPAQHDAVLHARLRSAYQPLVKDPDPKIRAWATELLQALDALAKRKPS